MKNNNPLATLFGSDKRWVVWQYKEVSGRKTKVPYTISKGKASTTDPSTWCTYHEAAAASDQVGIVFKDDRLLLGIDIDHVIEDGITRSDILKFVEAAQTYTEISPSKTGLHLYLALTEKLNLVKHRKAPFELYTSGRYFTVTGKEFGLPSKAVRTVTPDEALKLLGTIGYPWDDTESSAAAVKGPAPKPVLLEDGAVLEKMFKSKNGSKIKDLYEGGTSVYGEDESRADMALCTHLAFWTGKDAAQIERLWLTSPLGAREKTQKRKDYRHRTIEKAIAECGEILTTQYVDVEVEKFDVSKFKPLTIPELVDILGLTIKRDEHNKITAFFCELSAYTEEAQFNISFSAPSSTGKSFIPMEVAKLFPEGDVIMLAYSSPTAFFHDSKLDLLTNQYVVDLERKIIIFMDQPHYQLLEKLRPLLSHDRKEILLKITDKNMRGGLKTKNIIIRGYPSVVFCTADIELNDQEATRLLLLSPEISQEKIRAGVLSTIRKEADGSAYNAWIEQDPGRMLLKERIRAIKAENIDDINIRPELVGRIEDVFMSGTKMLKPRHQRDAKKLMSLVKAHTLLNVWHRERNGAVIFANEEDIEAAVHLWEVISVSQELNLPPYLYEFYVDVIRALWKERKESLEGDFDGRIGLTRNEILGKHRDVTGRLLDPETLRLKMLPMLETSGLITQEVDPTKDGRQRYVYLVSPEDILGAESVNNSVEEKEVEIEFEIA